MGTVVSEQKRSGGTQLVLSKEKGTEARIYRELLLCIGSKDCSSRKDLGEHPAECLIENKTREVEKQDCEQKGARRGWSV